MGEEEEDEVGKEEEDDEEEQGQAGILIFLQNKNIACCLSILNLEMYL